MGDESSAPTSIRTHTMLQQCFSRCQQARDTMLQRCFSRCQQARDTPNCLSDMRKNSPEPEEPFTDAVVSAWISPWVSLAPCPVYRIDNSWAQNLVDGPPYMPLAAPRQMSPEDKWIEFAGNKVYVCAVVPNPKWARSRQPTRCLCAWFLADCAPMP